MLHFDEATYAFRVPALVRRNGIFRPRDKTTEENHNVSPELRRKSKAFYVQELIHKEFNKRGLLL